MNLAEKLPESWRLRLAPTMREPYFAELERFLTEEYATERIFPPEKDLFRAFFLTPPEKLSVLILGQDPYHDENQAHGLAFSVCPGVRHPASLRNIFKELNADVGSPVPESGSLIPWAEQGVLLLNTVLTVRAHSANSHRNRGWETFTDYVIRKTDELPQPIVFVLWGGPAQKKIPLIQGEGHFVLSSAHPSPLSAYRGFFGSRPFSAINRFLREKGRPEIHWNLN